MVNELTSLKRTPFKELSIPKHNVDRFFPTASAAFSANTLGKVYTAHQNNSECYLRMVLHVIREPTYFQAIKSTDGQMCQTYREACFILGVFENDQHWDTTLTEALKHVMLTNTNSVHHHFDNTCTF
ncbi:helitron_like_N domain-containing protein [Trichonephila clavata]|uniref:Helitron_like_N domain-containing protein n=1 Tax=Trichonephila clavata TaxID=2740835 RepID=A0A8X6IKU4_TRICU|nr:helitron_like_N domain-containing protein [Trichonephila clavata]